MNDLDEIEAMLDNPLVMVSAIPSEDDNQQVGGNANQSVLNKSKTPQIKQM